MTGPTSRHGHLPSLLATWLFLLHEAGRAPADAELAAAAAALGAALRTGADPDPHGLALVGAVERRLAGADGPDAVGRFLVACYGEEAVDREMGADRAERSARAASYAFSWHRPWLAAIADRDAEGRLGPRWVLVDGHDAERVHCLDPYPWDDRDEAFDLPTVEFHVRWELAGCPGFRVR